MSFEQKPAAFPRLDRLDEKTDPPLPIPVALARAEGYSAAVLTNLAPRLLGLVDNRSFHGSKVLVKPNLLAATPPDFLPCTHSAVVRAVCRYLLDQGAGVRVGDSPSFGRGTEMALKTGLTEALADLPVELIDLNRPVKVDLPFGGRVGLSSHVLESDFIFSLPKLKVHHMVGLTAAVKNLFGCVAGWGKIMAHARYGDWGSCFESLLLELGEILPPVVSLVDGIIAMHVSGPVSGEPYYLNLLAASRSTVALDTALYHLVQATEAPLWVEAQKRGLPGAFIQDIHFPLEQPQAFEVTDFRFPESLKSFTFIPGGRLRRSLKHLWDLIPGL